MIAGLVKFPVRASVGAAELALKPVGLAARVTFEILEHVLSDSSGDRAPTAEPPFDDVTFPLETEAAEPERAPPPPPAPPPHPPAEPPAPAHVSEEPELVGESADPAAAEGSSAEVHVDEPWDGYRLATANEVLAALDHSSREQLAVIQLYELTHRGRKTVLAAVERELKAGSPPRIS